MDRTQAPSRRWIDEDLYRTTILSLDPHTTETDADEQLQKDAQELEVMLPERKNSDTDADVDVVAESLSGTTVSSHTQRNSIFSQSTAPTSCGSSARRSSTSLSQQSCLTVPLIDTTIAVPSVKAEHVKNSGLKNSLRKWSGLRRKKTDTSNISAASKARDKRNGSSSDDTVQYKLNDNKQTQAQDEILSENMFSKQKFNAPVTPENRTTLNSMDCEALVMIRTQQIEEKRKFLEYQTKLIQELLEERDQIKAVRRAEHELELAEKEEQNDKASEELEARQLEEELKQQREHETEKKAIAVRLKHMEAYCQTPSPPLSPVTTSFDRRRPSGDSMASHPERQVTQQHYENLAQVYHSRDDMDSLHAAKINVLRGKQKRALQTFMLKKEREIEQFDLQFQKQLEALDLDYGQKEAEIRLEFENKRHGLEARWKLRSLVEKTRLERITGLKYDDMPDLVVTEA